MSDAQNQPAPRARGGRLRLALAALLLLLASLVVLFRPTGPGTANPVHLRFQNLTTNAAHKVEAVFVASNGWHRQVDLWRVSVEEKRGNQWNHRFQQLPPSIALLPGEVAQVKAVIPAPEFQWRAETIWIVYSSRLTIWSWNFQAALGSVFPGIAPDPIEWFHRHARTNHWPENTE
jgi:hypothetical protein